MSFDPFGDFDTAGYLQNALQLKEPEEVKRAEHFTVFPSYGLRGAKLYPYSCRIQPSVANKQRFL